jgi:hypothetical protein
VDVDCWILQLLVESHLPDLADHLSETSFSVRAMAMPWLMGAFAGSLPLDLVLRLWDVMFFERNMSVLFRATLAILDLHGEVNELHGSSRKRMLLTAVSMICVAVRTN